MQRRPVCMPVNAGESVPVRQRSRRNPFRRGAMRTLQDGAVSRSRRNSLAAALSSVNNFCTPRQS